MLTTQCCKQQDESFTSHQNMPRETEDDRKALPDIISTLRCSCKSICQRKGCPCKAGSKLCGSGANVAPKNLQELVISLISHALS